MLTGKLKIRKYLDHYKYYIITAFIVIFTYLIFPVQAESNDDTSIMNYISGFYTGRPGILPYIMGTPYTFIISRLYMFNSQVPWYGLTFVVISLSAVLVILKVFLSNNKFSFVGYLCFVGIYFSILLYEIVQIQFTMVAGLAGAACVMMMIFIPQYEGNIIKDKMWHYMIMLLFMFFSFNIRYQCGYITLIFLTYIVIANGILLRTWNKNQIIALIFCFVIVLLSLICNKCYVANTGWKEYEKLNSERSLFMDTEHLPYEDYAEMYQSLGWDEVTYSLISHWCFMTEEASYEDFKSINAARLDADSPKLSSKNEIRNLLQDCIEFVSRQTMEVKLLIGEIVLLVGCFVHLYRGKKLNSYYLKLWIYVAGFVAIQIFLILYLINWGRYSTRVLLMIYSLSFIPLLYFVCSILRDKRNYMFLLVIVLLLLSITGIQKVKERWINDYSLWDKVDEYVMEHRENIYVGDGSMTSPRRLFISFHMGDTPINYFFWGGWFRESPFDDTHMDSNGIKELYLDDMLYENRFFIGDEKNKELLEHYYHNKDESITSRVYYETERFIVYGFRKQK